MAPRAKPESVPVVLILKWVAGIAAAVIGGLIVVVLVGSVNAVAANDRRLTVVETRNEARDKTLERIETKLGGIDKKLDELK